MKEIIFPVITKEELRVEPSAILFLPNEVHSNHSTKDTSEVEFRSQ